MNLLEPLRHIHPASLTYEGWYKIGMILKHEGYAFSDWDAWSAQDAARYHAGEMQAKWDSFREETDSIVTGGTLVTMAKERGWKPTYSGGDNTPVGWNDPIEFRDESRIIDFHYLEEEEIKEPDDKKWNPVQEIINYLEAVFSPEEYVGYVFKSYEKNGKWIPADSGTYNKTQAHLVSELKKYIGREYGVEEGFSASYNRQGGAWIRFNPMDGNGIRNVNVTDYRYTLIESDSLPINKQHAILKELQLPIAAEVYSGGKSIHAIVHIDAKNAKEYRERVDFLYAICEKNGLTLDKQNRNPSRLSRLPGVLRKGKKQFLICTNKGKKNFDEWKEYYQEQTDDLPDFESIAELWNHLPPLAPPLIDGILRQGHKMLISGASKAGKSFALIELAIAIASGTEWLGYPCKQGKAIYVNLELDRASCLHRFRDVGESLDVGTECLKNLLVWNLRGMSMQLDKLAPKLIRRAIKEQPTAIIIDPIYKVITGDENSAEQMANFCNQFDKICREIGCAVIYCHHHSKGAQGGKKAMDRASGSGVFARDPDALLDLIELPLKDSHYDYLKNDAACRTVWEFFRDRGTDCGSELGADGVMSKTQMMDFARDNLEQQELAVLEAEISAAEEHAAHTTAWRVSCTLREFAAPADRDIYFSHPTHSLDETGALADIRPDVEIGGRVLHQRDKAKSKEDKAKDELQALMDAYTILSFDKDMSNNEFVTVQEIIDRSEEFFGKPLKRAAIYKKLKKYRCFKVEKGNIRYENVEDEE